LIPNEILFVLSFIFLFFGLSASNKVISKKALFIPLSLIAIGLIYSFENQSLLITKDIFYFLSPILVFAFGQVFALHFTISEYIKYSIIISIFLGIVFLFNIDSSAKYESISELKEEQGMPSYFTILALSLCLISIRYKIFPLTNKLKIVILFLSLIVLLAFSRTFILVLILLLLFGFNQLRFNKNFTFKFIAISLVSTFSYLAILDVGTTDRTTFIGKISTSIKEISFSNYSSNADINQNWRGFEAFKGLQQVEKGTVGQLFLGQGFGKTAPLGFFMPLGDGVFSEIPKFHNGYITILLKTGIVGIFLYLFFFLKIVFVNLEDKEIFSDHLFVKNMLAGLAMVLIVVTFVIAGWLNTTSMLPFTFSLGFFYQLKLQLIKNRKSS
jgi:hypothetical protein